MSAIEIATESRINELEASIETLSRALSHAHNEISELRRALAHLAYRSQEDRVIAMRAIGQPPR